MSEIDLSFELDGQPQDRKVDGTRSALSVLREDLDQSTLRPGCSPQGVCGSCAVLVNGKFRLSCTLPARSLAGKHVQTLASWPLAEKAAAAFAAQGAVLGGYEIPGMLTQARALHEKGATDPAGADKGLLMHLQRGGSWTAIKAAIGSIEQAHPAPSLRHIERALGQAAIVEDLQRPGMRHAALVWVPGPRVTFQGLTLPELPPDVLVLSAEDLPLNLTPSQAELLLSKGSESRHAGEVVAIVLAPTRVQAQAVRDQIQVQAEVLEPVILLSKSRLAVASAMENYGRLPESSSAQIQTAFVAQGAACIEPPSWLAVPTQDGLTLYSNGECAGAEAALSQYMCGLEPGSVSVEVLGSRPSPGGRDELGLGPLVVSAANFLGRPVKLSLELGESARIQGRRHPAELELGLSLVDGDLALQAQINADSGGEGQLGEAFVYPAAAQLGGAYRLAHCEAEIRAYQTNNPPAGGMDGDGLLQTLVAQELAMDALAKAEGLTPLTLRTQCLHPDSNAAEFLEQLPDGPGWSHSVIALRSLGQAPAAVALEQQDGLVILHLDRARAAAWEEEMRAMLVAAGFADQDIEMRVHSGAPPSPSADVGTTLQALARAIQELPEEGHSQAEFTPQDTLFTAQRAAAAVQMDAQGQITQIQVFAHCGVDLLPVFTQARLQAAAQEGLGAILTEQALATDGVVDDRLRTAGLIKSRYLPPIQVQVVESNSPAVDPAAATRIAVAAAVACALAKFEGSVRPSFPARDAEAAYGMGIKRPRGPKP
ncbi:MAG: CO/xanthine dehydrogenase Mo-binding subunit [Cognaticolwellia sp.]|jgi:CO/xanthine dehydrogenase Mo-binding subunit/aerobic-type carbon monoxide dehydrogenase small subunit (CoxS/CutS family)